MGQFEDRKDYAKGRLIGNIDEPSKLLFEWLEAAKAADPEDYNAMTLSTLGVDGHPCARIVLLREVQDEGGSLVFYTNYHSSKGRELDAHPHAAVTFFWRELERQLRVRGRIERLDENESDRYFQSRPRASQIGAWTSDQSQALNDRSDLESKRMEVESRFPDDVPRPPHWGGYRLLIERLEFWQGRTGRLHDRVCFEKSKDSWGVQRLQP